MRVSLLYIGASRSAQDEGESSEGESWNGAEYDYWENKEHEDTSIGVCVYVCVCGEEHKTRDESNQRRQDEDELEELESAEEEELK